MSVRTQEIVWTIRNNGVYVGEMTAEDMEASMMNKDERRLEVLTFTDFEDVDETIKMLMGKEVKERKEYLFNNVDFSKLNRQKGELL